MHYLYAYFHSVMQHFASMQCKTNELNTAFRSMHVSTCCWHVSTAAANVAMNHRSASKRFIEIAVFIFFNVLF